MGAYTIPPAKRVRGLRHTPYRRAVASWFVCRVCATGTHAFFGFKVFDLKAV